MSEIKAVIHFRVIANGGFAWIKPGQKRGYWRVLVLRRGADDMWPARTLCSHGVCEVWMGALGIFGVTERSRYCINGDYARAVRIAEAINRYQRGRSCEWMPLPLGHTRGTYGDLVREALA